ncbi:MAG: MBL fold metallo-hydrolase [Thermodesulfovibrionales bacterium]|nr:MBL fold metallo-hydrolase [Thermodesulfovibrionales bacterium]
MIIQEFVVGPLENNCYILGDESSREALVIDPGDEPDRILDFIQEKDLTLKYIVCTHAHYDHVGAVPEIKEAIRAAEIVIHANDLDIYTHIEKQGMMWGGDLDPLPAPDILVKEGSVLSIGNMKFEVIHTPGHTPGGICLYGEGLLITGDTLFAGSVGRTDLYGGNFQELRRSFNRLMSMPDIVKVLPGHGPESTIGREKRKNFFALEG